MKIGSKEAGKIWAGKLKCGEAGLPNELTTHNILIHQTPVQPAF